MNKKLVAGFEMFLTICMTFSFCYFVDLSTDDFLEVVSASEDKSSFKEFIESYGSPEMIEEETWNSYEISSGAKNTGCCFLGEDGQVCGSAAPESCVSDSPFAEGALCDDTSFCQKGCCYDEDLGIFDKNVLEFACSADWTSDPNCNMPAAALGCCILGDDTIFETRGQCEVDTLALALGDEPQVEWWNNASELQCLYLSAVQREGACVIGSSCKFVTEADCVSYGGEFFSELLCTSPTLNTSCEMTRQTSCIDGHDEVFFLDSCGNRANVYDSLKVEDPDYWDKIAEPEDLCGAYDFETGNANNESCGNCNRFAGGICDSAGENGFDVEIGDSYCRDTSCMYDGEVYGNGESWCVYDGVIGEGRDVVGSRHWKYVCSQGEIVIEPCADYRNQICIQSTETEVNGESIEFSNAACVANNWRACINVNSQEDWTAEDCLGTLNCRIDNVNVADKFNFDVCLPKYPGGFSLDDARYQATAEQLCGMASNTCTVIRKATKSGGCKYVANKNCLSETFAQEMNDFCIGLGDCGGSVNIIGDYSENYNVRRSPMLSGGWIDKLISYATPIKGEFAEVEDYTEQLIAAGVIQRFAEAEGGSDEAGDVLNMDMVSMGLSGISYALEFAATGQITVFGVQTITITEGGGFLGGVGTGVAGPPTSAAASASAFAGAAMGAGIGMMVGSMLAQYLGLSPVGSMLMAIGGAMVGAVLGYMWTQGIGFAALGPVGWAILAVGIALMVIATFFGMGKCPPIKVEFECYPWQPLTGGDKCEECNGDPLKPCSEYRCSSLGAGCELINVGTDNELCVNANPNDVEPPVIAWHPYSYDDENVDYTATDGGIHITSSETGGCLDAYEAVSFQFSTSEPSQCKLDITPGEFDELNYNIGGTFYKYNHTVYFTLPDPSAGESQGSDWTGDLNLYILCQDRYGIVTPEFYEVEMCVVEGDDVTAPKIVAVEPANNSLVGVTVDSKNLTLITNELSTCRWSMEDVTYLEMENSFECDASLYEPSSSLGYACSGELPVDNSSNYYIRCMDQPWKASSSDRNAMSESFVYGLRKPESAISIEKIAPSEGFETSTALTTVGLKVATEDGGDYHYCSYSFSGYDKMIKMFETGADRTHVQTLNLAAGSHKIYVECEDETGDFARDVTQFKIVRDSSTPQVARVWQNGGFVNLILTEEAECKFSFDGCKFSWSEGYELGGGTEFRFAVVRGETYYIKCEDEFGNLPSGCSVEVMAT